MIDCRTRNGEIQLVKEEDATHYRCNVTIDTVDETDGGMWKAVFIGYHENNEGTKTDYELHQYSQIINLQGKP